jgi:hypothetical protein
VTVTCRLAMTAKEREAVAHAADVLQRHAEHLRRLALLYSGGQGLVRGAMVAERDVATLPAMLAK